MVVTAAALTGCAAHVSVEVAPHATDPDCARIVLALPDELGGLAKVDTNSQATAAWGTAETAITLRCGVEPPGPTTDQCVTVETPAGPSVDWVVVAAAGPADGATASPGTDTDWTFTTYGRDPAVQVVVPAAVAADRSTSFIDALGPAVAQVAATRACL